MSLPRPESTRVVITAAECLTALGTDRNSTFDAMLAGQVGIKPSPAEIHYNYPEAERDPFPYEVNLTAPVEGFTAQDVSDVTGIKGKNKLGAAHRSGLFSMYAVAKALQAASLAHEGSIELIPSSEGGPDRTRVGMCIGTGIAGADALVGLQRRLQHPGENVRRIPRMPEAFLSFPERTVTQPGMYSGAQGPTHSVNAACASSNVAWIGGIEKILTGQADVMVVGGVEAQISPVGLAIFYALTALTKESDVALGSIPFDQRRSGFVLGEGAGMLVLESEAHAVRRGAQILGYVEGFCHNSDGGKSPTAPDEERTASCMRMAIEMAGREVLEGGLIINAHATSTLAGDENEANAMKAALGDDIDKADAVMADKSYLGHPAGAAGGIEACNMISALERRVVPSIANTSELIPEAEGLPIVIGKPKEVKSRVGLSNSFGFGGHNATVIVRREG